MNEEQRQRAIELINEDLQHTYQCGRDGAPMPSDTAEEMITGLLSMIDMESSDEQV